jgi:glutamate formiminotransferase
MNVTDLEATPLHVAVERVRREAAARGVEVAESELIGLLPLQAALGAATSALGLPHLGPQKVIELAAREWMPDNG